MWKGDNKYVAKMSTVNCRVLPLAVPLAVPYEGTAVCVSASAVSKCVKARCGVPARTSSYDEERVQPARPGAMFPTAAKKFDEECKRANSETTLGETLQ